MINIPQDFLRKFLRNFYAKVIQRPEPRYMDSTIQEKGHLSYALWRQLQGEQKKLNVPPQAYQRVLILCICEVCLPYSTGLLGSYAFTKLKEICTLFMKGATKKYYCDVLWCMWSVSEVLLVGFFICYAYKLQVPEVYNIKGLRLSFNKKKKSRKTSRSHISYRNNVSEMTATLVLVR